MKFDKDAFKEVPYDFKPKVSIVMPILNALKYIHVALEGIVRQSFDGWELIVMDGGSTDGTLEVIAGFVHPNIRVFSEPDKGPFHAITKGFERARGDYFMTTTSSDAYLDHDWLQLCVDALDSDPEVSLVWGIPAYCTEDGKVGGPHGSFAQFLKRNTVAGWFWRSLKSKYRSRIPEKAISKLFQLAAEDAPRSFNSSFISLVVRKLFRLGADDVQKQNWFDLWLDTKLCFPDLNMCYRRIVYEQCMPPPRLEGRFQDEFTSFFFNFNQLGFLPLCVPRIVNFGRTHAAQIGAMFSAERQQDTNNYLCRVRNYAEGIRKGRITHVFRDGSGAVIGQW